MNQVEPVFFDHDGYEIGIGEIPIVLSFFFFSLKHGDAGLFVPASSGLETCFHRYAGFFPVGELALDFVGAGAFERPQASEIFHFGDGRFILFAIFRDDEVDVGFESHLALLHVRFAHAKRSDEGAKLGAEDAGFFGGG